MRVRGRFGSPIIWLLLLLPFAGCGRRELPAAIDISPYSSIAVVPFRTDGYFERYGAEIADQVVIELIDREARLRVVELPPPSPAPPGAEPEEDPVDALARAAREAGADLLVSGSCLVRVDWVRRAWLARQAYATATVRVVDTRQNRVLTAWRETATSETQALPVPSEGYPVEPDTVAFRVDRSDPELREAAIVQLATRIVSRLGVR